MALLRFSFKIWPLVLAACAAKVTEEGQPCPCGLGWTCCFDRGVCLEDANACRSQPPDSSVAIEGGDEHAVTGGTGDASMADAEVAEDSGAPGLVAPLLPPPDPASATSFLINPAHTNSVANATFSPPLARLWSADLDGTPSYPLIADGRVFVGVSGQVLALDQTTGEKLWSADLAQGFFGHAYEAGRLFTVDASGVVTAFSAATGQVEWTRSVIGPFFTSSTVIPTAYRGIVYVTAPSTPTVYLNSDTVAVTVFGFDEATGTTVLRQSEMFSDSTAPAVTDNGIVIGYDAAIANYDYLSGELLWSLNYNTDSSDIVVNGSYVYASELGYATGTDVSLDIATGNSAGAFAATVAPAFDGSLGFFVFGDQLSAVDLSSGLTRWTALGPVGDDSCCRPSLREGMSILSTTTGISSPSTK